MLAAGLLAATLNWMLLRGPGEGRPVAVAARDVAAGQTLDPAALRTVGLHLPDDLAATLVDPATLDAGAVVTRALRAGEPIRASDLRRPGAGDGLRAMSVPIPPEHAAAGALRPGDRVDVIEVRDGMARYLATGLEVLAAEDTEGGGGIGGLRAYSVTLAVDDRTALRLALALRTADLELVRATGAPAPTTTETRAEGSGPAPQGNDPNPATDGSPET